jgi:hemoglobin/transferrin/lactoferrin receptor protein
MGVFYKTVLFLTLTSVAFGQKDTTVAIGELVVTANKFEQLKKESPAQIFLLNKKQINAVNAPNTGILLEQTGQVFLQKSQAGGGSPVLRGFEASKVLLVVDGVRLNNAIYRAGHLQNILRVDQNVLEKVEVVFGPNSVIYGSDALGGVIHMQTMKPKFSQKNFGAMLRYGSAFSEKTVHGDFNLGAKNIASLSSFTVSSFGDLKMGKKMNSKYPDFGFRNYYSKLNTSTNQYEQVANLDPYTQAGSGYGQLDLLQKISVKTGNILHTLNVQYSTTGDVPRYDRLTEMSGNKLKYAQWYYGPESRALFSYELNLGATKVFDKSKIILANQVISESRNSQKFGSANLKSQNERVNVSSINMDFQKFFSQNVIQYGLEATINQVDSKATNTALGIVSAADTRYPDGGSKMNTLSVYLTDEFKVTNNLILNAGARLNQSSLEAKFIEKAFFPFPFDNVNQKNTAFTGNFGLVYLPSGNTKIAVMASSGYRTPNVDDLTKVFESSAGNLIVPNPTIKPEYTFNKEINIAQKIGDKVSLEAGVYHTGYRNIIVVSDFTLDGKSEVLYDGKLSKVLAAQNRDKAQIYGAFASLDFTLYQNLRLNSSINYTRGKLNDGSPLDHIPPVFGKTRLVYSTQKVDLEFFAIYNGAKKLSLYSNSGEDNLQYATPEGALAWTTFNFRSGYQIAKAWKMQVAVENIFDLNYRTFASGISAAGRNVQITSRFDF